MGQISIRLSDVQEAELRRRAVAEKRPLAVFIRNKILYDADDASDLNRTTIESRLEKLEQQQKKIVEVVAALERRQSESENFWFDVFSAAIGEYIGADASENFQKTVRAALADERGDTKC